MCFKMSLLHCKFLSVEVSRLFYFIFALEIEERGKGEWPKSRSVVYCGCRAACNCCRHVILARCDSGLRGHEGPTSHHSTAPAALLVAFSLQHSHTRALPRPKVSRLNFQAETETGP